MIGTVLLWITILVAVLGILQLVVSKNKKSSRIYWFILVPVFLTFGAFFLYLFLFLTHNFTFVNVFQNANLAMHPIQLVFCSWSGQSGSLFLWLLFTDITALIAWKDKKLWKETSIVLLLIHIILCILLLQSQPFATHNMMVSDGMGLNPVLSHPFMVLHPPFAFFAYSFLTLFMAKGFASLFHPSDTEWIYANRLYLYISFFGLTITMILGSR